MHKIKEDIFKTSAENIVHEIYLVVGDGEHADLVAHSMQFL